MKNRKILAFALVASGLATTACSGSSDSITDQEICEAVINNSAVIVKNDSSPVRDDSYGIKNTLNAILIGAGHLGKALLNFDEFKSTGLNIVGAFDVNPLLYEIDINGVNVYPMERIEDFIEKHDVSIAILTIPSSVVQDIVNRLEKTDIKAIWNFAPVNLVSKTDIIIETTLLSQSYANIYHRLILNQKRRGK